MNNTQHTTFLDEHIGKKVKFYLEDGALFTGTITGYPNEDHVSVLVDHAWTGWEWYVRSEAVLFV